jgi:predicted phage terminase large subunit-like protein
MALDPSKGKDAKVGDYQALVRLGRDKHGVLYVEAWLDRRDVATMCHQVVDTHRLANQGNDPVEAVALEVNGFQELLSIPFEQAAGDWPLPLVPLNNTTKKEVRIRRLSTYLAQKLFRFKRTPGTELLVQQMKDFPNGTHDDGPDALEMALRVAIQVFNERYS